MPINELKLARELIRRPSITPKDAGAINILAKYLRSLGFKCQMMNFKNIKNLYAKFGKSSPNFCFAGHTDVVPVGDLKSWSVNPFSGTVKNNKLITPTLSASALDGITQKSIITLSKDMNLEVKARKVSKKELKFADEIFLSGTAAEITPIIKLDKKKIGDGKVGKITKSLMP